MFNYEMHGPRPMHFALFFLDLIPSVKDVLALPFGNQQTIFCQKTHTLQFLSVQSDT